MAEECGNVEVKSVAFAGCTIPSSSTLGGSTEKTIQIDCVDGTAFLVKENWEGTINHFSSDVTEQARFWVDENTTAHTPSSQSLYLFLFPPSDTSSLTTVYLSVSGADIDTCGNEMLPCKTIHIGYSHKTLQTTFLKLIDGSNHDPETVSTEISVDAEFAIHANDSIVTKTVSNITADQLFLISSGTLTFSTITFTLNDTPGNILSCPLMKATAGELKIEFVSISPASTTTSLQISLPLLVITNSESLTVTSCSFSNVTVTTSDETYYGGVISADLSDSSHVIITGTDSNPTSFASCTSTNLIGGAIGVVTQTGSLSVTHSTFEGCTSKNGEVGGDGRRRMKKDEEERERRRRRLRILVIKRTIKHT